MNMEAAQSDTTYGGRHIRSQMSRAADDVSYKCDRELQPIIGYETRQAHVDRTSAQKGGDTVAEVWWVMTCLFELWSRVPASSQYHCGGWF